jgi:ankyrin repeat protein
MVKYLYSISVYFIDGLYMDVEDESAGSNGLHEKLLDAVRAGDVQVVEMLLRQCVPEKAFINIKDYDGRTALVEAARFGRTSMAEFLLKRGADPNLTANDGRTALIEAAWLDHTDLAQTLLSHGADPNIKEVDGRTALIGAAARHGGSGMVRLLLDQGADPNLQELDGGTALFQAACEMQINTARLLLERGANPNLENLKGRTPLMVASCQGDIDLVHLLLDCGADSSSRNNENKTAQDMAHECGHENVTSVLPAAIRQDVSIATSECWSEKVDGGAQQEGRSGRE